jgi:hypothetical protein
MITRAELHASFKISQRAMKLIYALRDRVTEEDGEIPEALVIKWVKTIFNDGRETPYTVGLGFYDRQLFSQVQPGYWTIIHDMKIVFFVIERDFPHFYGKTLDLDSDGVFFLRD